MNHDHPDDQCRGTRGRALRILVLVLPGVLIQIRGVLGDVPVEHYNLARHVLPLLCYELYYLR